MLYGLIFIGFALSVFLSALIIPRILVVAFRKRLFDMPNERTVHEGAIPRLGGLSFVPTICFSMAFIGGMSYIQGYAIPNEKVGFLVPEFCLLVCGLTLLYLAGIKDDLVGLRYRAKFIIQIVAACFFPLSGLWINNFYGLFGLHEISSFLGIPLTILIVVFITNAINLIDGIDGLASGLSSVALVLLGGLFLYNQVWLYAALAFSTFGVLLPFFYYNVFGQVAHGKKIFMGDTGSQTLGYILSFLSIRYSSYNPDIMPYHTDAIVIAFSTLIVPVFDVFRVILVRARNRRHLFSPDRNHIHHKFLAMGVHHRKAMICILTIACLFALSNIWLLPYVNINLLFLSDVAVWTLMNMVFDRVRDKRKARMVLTE